MSKTPHSVHGSCVARGGRSALLRGTPGSGKSDLALRFLSTYPDAWLIADDQVVLTARNQQVIASAPAALRGLLEVRGLGLLRRAVPAAPHAMPVCLIVDMMHTGTPPRIAEPRFETLCGVLLPVIPIAPFEASAPLKLALALETIGGGAFPGDDGLLV
ncbi:aldolase [Pyruvatibacter sp.]|uniref:HPr kinase/phosphorylase n=1 Tax=Pyruvatibacter sp. TaxID=1981328 RepID=UPI0032ED1251